MEALNVCELGHEGCTSAWHYSGDVPGTAFDDAEELEKLRDEYESERLSATLGLCTFDPAHGAAEVPWSGERLCWDCADLELDLLALALQTENGLPVYIKAR